MEMGCGGGFCLFLFLLDLHCVCVFGDLVLVLWWGVVSAFCNCVIYFCLLDILLDGLWWFRLLMLR